MAICMYQDLSSGNRSYTFLTSPIGMSKDCPAGRTFTTFSTYTMATTKLPHKYYKYEYGKGMVKP